MRRRFLLAILSLAGLATVAAAVAAAAAGPESRDRGDAALHRGARYFAVTCGFSHRNNDDAIVFPNRRGASHQHTYFGNTTTDAASTPASLRAAGSTTCRLRADTAAYWAPTLFVDDRAIEPLGAVVFYVRRTIDEVQAPPQGLKVVAGDATARSPQNRNITTWRCSSRRAAEPSSSVPTCAGGRSNLLLQISFPNCWNGTSLDSADHKSHMAYSSDGRCPATHPVEVPGIVVVIQYPVAGGSAAQLSSGGQFSGHADFVNAWNQRTLEALVDRYLNRRGGRGPR